MINMINGETFKNMVMEAACAIEINKVRANELNVFPVPDGDTGTNMSMTMAAAYRELDKLTSPTVGKVSEVAASALLRAARGNSGVIVSLLFRGMSKVLKGLAQCDGKQFAEALSQGVTAAYQAVMKPAEGTILTVSRRTAECAKESAEKNDDIFVILTDALKTAEQALKDTTGQNPVLQRAKVVDSGGFGFYVMLEGMHKILGGSQPTKMSDISSEGKEGGSAQSNFTTESINFTYCTEFIAQRDNKDVSVNKLRQFLQNIGDSAVVVDDDEIVKVHVHTNKPDSVLSEALKFGPLLSIKIENMKKQHTSIVNAEEEKPVAPTAPEKPYGFIAVAAGDGIKAVFKDLGVDRVVSGGQTMNPSTEDILAAAEAIPAETIFIFPNNKNIFMAATQAVELCVDRRLIVIPSATIPQGITAMLSFDETLSPSENRSAMISALGTVRTGQVTYAVRDSDFDGKKIHSGDYIALADGKLHSYGKNQDAVIRKMAKEIFKDSVSFVTLIYGEGVSEEELQRTADILKEEAKGAEINIINGGQPVYYYIISAE